MESEHALDQSEQTNMNSAATASEHASRRESLTSVDEKRSLNADGSGRRTSNLALLGRRRLAKHLLKLLLIDRLQTFLLDLVQFLLAGFEA